ncbi:putative transcription factor & chromatin remodeling ARID family [Helianthus annuus]|nr:putative transcription factor & chromatin remodeling ARID family [Helianthus annuus]
MPISVVVNVLILQAMSFKEFQDCKALLDMLDDEEYVMKYKYHLEDKFNDMVDWFLKEILEITTRPLPAYASDNRKVCLLDLYMAVKREGGHRRITENNMWAMISKDIGFDYNEGEYMRLIYAMYLDVLIYYYKYKSTQEKVHEKEEVKTVVDPRRSKSDGDKMLVNKEDQSEGNSKNEDTAGTEGEHYAFFAGDDWQGIKRMHTRRRLNFNQAKAAVDDANKSVLMHSCKHNYFLGSVLECINIIISIYIRIVMYIT